MHFPFKINIPIIIALKRTLYQLDTDEKHKKLYPIFFPDAAAPAVLSNIVDFESPIELFIKEGGKSPMLAMSEVAVRMCLAFHKFTSE